MDAPLRRIVVIGRAGSGKTTVAVRLGERLGLPVVHLDRLFWGPGWRELPRDVFDAAQTAAIAGDAWVMDGGYLSSLGFPARIRRADAVVLVESPLPVCLWRIVARAIRRGGPARPDLPAGCDELLSPYFLWWTVTWRWRNRDLAARLRSIDPGVRVLGAREALDLASW